MTRVYQKNIQGVKATDTDSEMNIGNLDTEFEFKQISFPVKSIVFISPETVFRELIFLFFSGR